MCWSAVDGLADNTRPRPDARIEVFGSQIAGLDLRDPPRLEIVLLVETHRLAVEFRVGALNLVILPVVRAADADRAEMVDLAALAYPDCECLALCRRHVERATVAVRPGEIASTVA
jgi:hypothetical protein